LPNYHRHIVRRKCRIGRLNQVPGPLGPTVQCKLHLIRTDLVQFAEPVIAMGDLDRFVLPQVESIQLVRLLVRAEK
jgi:hypothetical protein